MRLNIYGRFQLDVRREQGHWVAYRLRPGKRVVEEELVIPPDVDESELAVYLDDIYHELAGPGQEIEALS